MNIIKELMLGDLVNYRSGWINEETNQVEYESSIGFPVKIEMLYYSNGEWLVQYNDGENNGIEAADYEIFPIPLTPEILEKNGFEFGYTTSEEEFCSAVGCGYPEEKGWCYDEGAGEIKIIFPNETDGGLIRLDDQSADKHLELVFVKPIMVHELQHALRLCGIEKEIEL